MPSDLFIDIFSKQVPTTQERLLLIVDRFKVDFRLGYILFTNCTEIDLELEVSFYNTTINLIDIIKLFKS